VRVGIVAPPWTPVPPPLYGGIELVVDRLARGLERAGASVVLYTTGDSTCPVERRFSLERAEGQRIGSAVPELRHVMAAYESLDDCDVVHDHTVMGPVYAERFPGVRVCTTVHGPLGSELDDIYRRIADRVPVIAISHAQARRGPSVAVAAVIHHGLDAEDFPLGDGGGGYLAFVGRMAHEKGAHRAIEVARRAGLPLRIAAKKREAPEVAYFDEFVAPHLGEDVVYLGEISHEDKLDLLAQAKALLFPIRWPEPFGMVMLEALACGTPVLAFPEGAAPEVIEHGVTGFLVPDEDAMVAAVGRLGEIDRKACRGAVEGYFSTDRMVAEHLRLYEQMLAGELG
jgi:glycosyltransferase involved in cell wall biosynthesis